MRLILWFKMTRCFSFSCNQNQYQKRVGSLHAPFTLSLRYLGFNHFEVPSFASLVPVPFYSSHRRCSLFSLLWSQCTNGIEPSFRFLRFTTNQKYFPSMPNACIAHGEQHLVLLLCFLLHFLNGNNSIIFYWSLRVFSARDLTLEY